MCSFSLKFYDPFVGQVHFTFILRPTYFWAFFLFDFAMDGCTESHRTYDLSCQKWLDTIFIRIQRNIQTSLPASFSVALVIAKIRTCENLKTSIKVNFQSVFFFYRGNTSSMWFVVFKFPRCADMSRDKLFQPSALLVFLTQTCPMSWSCIMYASLSQSKGRIRVVVSKRRQIDLEVLGREGSTGRPVVRSRPGGDVPNVVCCLSLYAFTTNHFTPKTGAEEDRKWLAGNI